ncbi:VOC family protein [Streptomyces goshikiensis]|uniref:VOC family protein n=1 Tax=Streptomyces goshikiensis TaxID=1942 RepID=UPI0036BE796A
MPEPKTVKNRIHLRLRPTTSREEEVERLSALGATLIADHREPDGAGRAVLADPEGNEFRVLRSESDHAAMPSWRADAQVGSPVAAGRGHGVRAQEHGRTGRAQGRARRHRDGLLHAPPAPARRRRTAPATPL